MPSFIFASDPSAFRASDTLVFEVDPRLADKKALLAWFADRLKFPEHFGSNWDAFDESLRDLSWISQRKIVLFHRDLPLAGNPKDRMTYLDVLVGVVRDWQSHASHEFVVVMNPSLATQLSAAGRG